MFTDGCETNLALALEIPVSADTRGSPLIRGDDSSAVSVATQRTARDHFKCHRKCDNQYLP